MENRQLVVKANDWRWVYLISQNQPPTIEHLNGPQLGPHM